MSESNETQQERAVRLVKRQIDRAFQLTDTGPTWASWYSTTRDLLTRYLPPDSTTTAMFERISWISRSTNLVVRDTKPKIPPSEIFRKARDRAVELLKAAAEQIEDHGVLYSAPKAAAPTKSGGIHQHYYGPVTIQNQANAADNAIQNIGRSTEIKNDLREVRKLLSESMKITGEQYNDALKAIEGIATESKKPEPRRDWKSMLGWGKTIIDISTKATDLAHELGPHTAAIMHFIQNGAKLFGL